ncbi:ParB/RepB/Spo0J family partition protein [Pontixanthobacter aestiaquae]|uniref:ParB/RepB/Spo0J family partition protein n=1 Tax=Pontixanthobacter aestiaquae TaxID=1509367 RepID=A0A844Z885_9SPHN|nr:ParB/RepB/Spo0J family partition protein [Pontixanthobacter aestiaquae]MDN3646899.1 ParB/RepB/Spo0J family partition protein [Pontixanthobacter aestiaquae]MXO82119.1 ParB/RepB/Spo0J family partition protein [Pontixanthobacter aestiaquae]
MSKTRDPSDPIRLTVPPRAADKKKKLGRGLGALMGETRKEEPLVRRNSEVGSSSSTLTPTADPASAFASTSGLASLAISSIEPLPGQPRTKFDESALDELAASIAARGVIQPIIVRPGGKGKYQLVAGERRWRAAQKAQLHQIPAIVRELDEREVMALALIENLQREDLNPVEEARAYQRLSQQEDMTQAEIARLVDKSRSHVANIQRLLGLPDDVLDFVEAGDLSMGHARALIGYDDAAQLAKKAVSAQLSVREVEKLVKSANAPEGEQTRRQARPSRDPAKDADIAAVQGHLEEFLGLPVTIKTDSDPRSGAVTIKYRTLDQLDLICQRLTGGDI